MAYNELRNNPDIIGIISDCFVDFEDYYKNKVTCQLKEVIINNNCLEIFKKKSTNEYLCDEKDLKRHYTDASINFREYLTIKDGNRPEAKNYSEEGFVFVVLVTVNNKENLRLIFTFDILSQLALACNRLEYEFGRNFKLLFYDDLAINTGQITIGIAAKKMSNKTI